MKFPQLSLDRNRLSVIVYATVLCEILFQTTPKARTLRRRLLYSFPVEVPVAWLPRRCHLPSAATPSCEHDALCPPMARVGFVSPESPEV